MPEGDVVTLKEIVPNYSPSEHPLKPVIEARPSSSPHPQRRAEFSNEVSG